MTALSFRESADLAALEAEIEQDRDEWLSRNVARLTRIRDERLYRDDYPTFEEYCQTRWGLTRRHVNHMIQHDAVSAALGTVVPNERQARELAPLLDQPERLRETWQQVNEQTGGKPTAALLRAAVRSEPVRVTTTTTTETVTADPQTDEVRTEADWRDQEGFPAIAALDAAITQPAPNPIAAARAEVMRQPVMVAEKAFDRLRQARLTFEAAGSGAEIVADLANSNPETDNTAFWLAEIERTGAVLTDLAGALRRRNLRSVRP